MSEPRVHDFRKSWWGHALHSPRMEVGEEPRSFWQRVLRRAPRRFSYLSAMGHASPRPIEGDTILVAMESGKTARFRVADVRYLCDPRDMFYLKRADFVGYLDHPQ